MDARHMEEALKIAERGKGSCAPNPSVGAVVVKHEKVLAVGYHRGPGFPHAEVEALRLLGTEAEGATVYVTLEPCCHWGRTPPCTDYLIEQKVARVVYALTDPNPIVSGKGIEKLTAAGIECTHFPSSDVNAFYRSYHHWTLTRLPYVTAKLALTLNGKIAGPGGIRRKLTSEVLDRETHRLRKRSDAILTTSRTILADDPLLNVRLSNESESKVLYVLDRNHRLEGESPQCFRAAKRVVLFTSVGTSGARESSAEIRAVEENGMGLSLASIFKSIGQDGVHDLLVEAGGTLFRALVNEQRLNEARLYHTPLWWEDDALSAFESGSEQKLFSSVREWKWKGFGPEAICEMVW